MCTLRVLLVTCKNVLVIHIISSHRRIYIIALRGGSLIPIVNNIWAGFLEGLIFGETYLSIIQPQVASVEPGTLIQIQRAMLPYR